MKQPVPFGKYYLLDRISVGGMAEVFKAKAFGVEGFERLLAVKRILPSIAEDEEFITMFIDEAKIAVQLTHANIAQIFDLGKVGDSYFIAMEYVEGKDLRAIFDRLKKKGQTVSLPMAAYCIMKICEGLDYAHNKKDAAGRDLNLVHRDVSPQNVLVSYDGQIKIIDFGIAKAAGKAGKTQAGILKGKFGYMSPEQVRGMPLDRRSDIFAVGICLWELVTGERLFIGESDFSTLEKVRNVDIVPPSSFNKRIPEELEKIILKALSKEVEDRYQSAMDLHDDLQSWMYTSGSFFSRKDLAAFQQEVFREDIEKMAAKNEQYDDALLRSSVPPPPAPARPGSSVPAVPRPSLPQTTPPSPPRPTGTPAAPPTPRPTSPGASMPPSPPRVSVPPSPKKTVLGMPAVNVPTTPGLPPDLSKGQVAAPQGADVDMEWDDDEEPTNILSKNTAAQMVAAASPPKPEASAAPPKPAAPVPTKTPAPAPAPPRSTQSAAASAPALGMPAPASPDSVSVSGVTRPGKSKTKSLIIGISVGVVVAVIAAIAIVKVLFAPAGTVELNITPGDELSVIVDGSNKLPQNVSPMIIEGLSKGEHSFIIRRDGYAEKTLIFDVTEGKTISTNVTLEKVAESTAGFYLETEPPGCTVEVDGRVVDDKTPLTVSNIAPGNHAVKISKENYADLRFDVEVGAGEHPKLPIKKLTLAKVEVTFNTAPQGARVTLLTGGRRIEVGRTPATYEVATDQTYEVEYACASGPVIKPLASSDLGGGSDKVSLSAVACAAAATSAPIHQNRVTPRALVQSRVNKSRVTQPAAAQASGGLGWLSVQTKPWSKVYINGTFVKNTPLVKKQLKAGKYNITVENEGFGIKRQFSVTIKAGETKTLVKKLL